MKTILCSSCYLDGYDIQGNDRLLRTIRYVEYYSSIKDELEIDKIKLIDNGSCEQSIDYLYKATKNFDLDFESFPHLEHHIPGTLHHYPNCWRALYQNMPLIEQGYEKILMIDTDTFICSKKLATFIRQLNSGWNVFWCKRWNFPSAELSVLCQDSFPILFKFAEKPWPERVGTLMEREIPYTRIHKDWNCDRYGEVNAKLTENIDCYSQMGPNITPRLL